MNKMITLLALLLSLTMLTNTVVQAKGLQRVTINKAPAKFNKAIFTKLLFNSGINKKEFDQIGLKAVVNSLSLRNGKWIVLMSKEQYKQLIKDSDGKLSMIGFGNW